MTTERDCLGELQAHLQRYHDNKTPVQILAGQSKAFYGNPVEAEPLSVCEHRGIVHYEPTELIITARCGTPLREIEDTLSAQQQMLGFEPPHFADTATLGGCVATGLSGPGRPYRGAVRDHVLGMQIINGKAEVMRFGGEVMKNVAGYDVSRLLTASQGTLGIITEVSLRVLPKPEKEQSYRLELDESTAIRRINELSAQAYPITAACYDGQHLTLRLSGNEAAVNYAHKQIGGDAVKNDILFWQQLREQQHPFFNRTQPLWRLSLAAATPPLEMKGRQFIDWAGAQRWLITDDAPEKIRKQIDKLGGHATLFRHANNQPVFHPVTGKLRELHMNLKLAFDPHCLLNPGRLYPDF